MSRDYPDRVNPDRVAAQRRTFTGKLPLAAFDRLADLLDRPLADEALSFEAAFDQDTQGQVLVDLQVSGRVPLICQRTLNRFWYPVQSQSKIGIVRDEEAALALPEDYEPLVVADDELMLKDLVEEEVLLALPLVPVAPGTEPIGEDESNRVRQLSSEPMHRPFGVLEQWKSDPTGSNE